MKKQLLLLCLFHCCTFVLNAQTQENNTKCCVVIGCYNTDKDPCKPSRTYEVFPAEMDEIKQIQKEFSEKHPFPEVPWGFYPGQYVVVIEYTNRGCTTKGMAFVYSNSFESCKKQIDKAVADGYYNHDYKIVYQWGDDTFTKATTTYIDGIRVDIFTHIKTGKIVRLFFHNTRTENATARAFILQPSGEHQHFKIDPGTSAKVTGTFESGSAIKIVYEEYKDELDWDTQVIEKLKGEVRKLVTNPKGKTITISTACMCVRG